MKSLFFLVLTWSLLFPSSPEVWRCGLADVSTERASDVCPTVTVSPCSNEILTTFLSSLTVTEAVSTNISVIGSWWVKSNLIPSKKRSIPPSFESWTWMLEELKRPQTTAEMTVAFCPELRGRILTCRKSSSDLTIQYSPNPLNVYSSRVKVTRCGSPAPMAGRQALAL